MDDWRNRIRNCPHCQEYVYDLLETVVSVASGGLGVATIDGDKRLIDITERAGKRYHSRATVGVNARAMIPAGKGRPRDVIGEGLAAFEVVGDITRA